MEQIGPLLDKGDYFASCADMKLLVDILNVA
jgi:hypothetical protein